MCRPSRRRCLHINRHTAIIFVELFIALQVLAEARRVVQTLDREDAQRRRALHAQGVDTAAATALYSIAHKVQTAISNHIIFCSI